MQDYFVYAPWWLRRLYPHRVWRMPVEEKIVYLTFDDGPHPEITPFVLEQLAAYKAKATFFCIGENVDRHPSVFRSILEAGQSVGNHTQHHVNGWETSTENYLADAIEANDRMHSNWFRPPYGRMTSRQARAIKNAFPEMRFAMWDVLTGDFDASKTSEWCFRNVEHLVKPGSIIVMHDSAKALDRLKVCLPMTLEWLNRNGFRLEKLPGS